MHQPNQRSQKAHPPYSLHFNLKTSNVYFSTPIYMNWIKEHKKGLIIGFLIGAFVTPLIAILGLAWLPAEILRPILIGPMDLISGLIPDTQTAPNTYYVPWYKWVVTLGFNGLCYAIVGGLIQMAIKSKKDTPQKTEASAQS